VSLLDPDMMVPDVASMLLNFLIIPQKTVGSNPGDQGSHGKSWCSPLLLFSCAGFCTYRETLIMHAA
jgi:hypothetical protein